MRRIFFTNNGNNYQSDINFRVGGTVGAHSPAVRRALLRKAQGQYAKGCCDVVRIPSPLPPLDCAERIFIDFSPQSSGTEPAYNYFVPGPISDSQNTIIQGGWSGGAQPYFTNDSTDDETITSSIFYSSPYSWYIGKTTLYGSPGQGSPFTPKLPIETNAINETAFNSEIITRQFTYKFRFYVNSSGSGSGPQTAVIYNGSYAGNDRTGFNLYLTNNYNSVSVDSYSYGGGSFPFNNIATGLTVNEWHNIEINITYDADPENETFLYSVDGTTPVNVLSWINVWRKANSYTYSYGTRMAFTCSANNDSDTGIDSGFYIDDIDICMKPLINNTQSNSIPLSIPLVNVSSAGFTDVLPYQILTS